MTEAVPLDELLHEEALFGLTGSERFWEYSVSSLIVHLPYSPYSLIVQLPSVTHLYIGCNYYKVQI